MAAQAPTEHTYSKCLSRKPHYQVSAEAETEGTLMGAMIRLMSDYLLRISEVVAVNVNDPQDNTLTLRASKTDQEGTGETLHVCDATRHILRQYLKCADITREVVLRSIRRGGHIQP